MLLCEYIFNGGRQELIKADAKLDGVNEDGDTALMWASAKGNVEMVKLLHEAKADLNVCCRYGTALHRAVILDHMEVLKVVVLNERIVTVFVFLLLCGWTSNYTLRAHLP